MSLVLGLRVAAACAICGAVFASISVAGPSAGLIASLALSVGAAPLARLIEDDDRPWLPWLMVIVANCVVLLASIVYA